LMCKGDQVTHPKQQKSFYQEKLTEEIVPLQTHVT